MTTIACHGKSLGSRTRSPTQKKFLTPVIAPNCRTMVRKLAKTAFFIGLMAVIALSLLPQENLPETGMWDKLNHALVYGVLAVLGGFGFKGWRSLLMVGIGLVVLGAGLELAQSVIPDRTGSTYDVLANFVGVAIGSVATVGASAFLRDQ